MNFPLSAAAFCLAEPAASVTMSPLVLADRLLTLARDADRAGFPAAADKLVHLCYAIWDGDLASA